MKIKAQINHGNTVKTLEQSGDRVSECLENLAILSSYIPQPSEAGGRKVVTDLESTGRASLGWVDYRLIK
ncbi:MAG: hypothetical protein EBR82_66765 [Caulobacteraceae bacterium]|nr:hypothetical protein [Caulobacteraceae bacterium]